jgi:SnoaL-like domain
MAASKSLEDRIRAIEDRLEIYNIIASHPPSADTGGKDHIAASWVEDGIFDRDENLSSPSGRESIANQVLSADHQAAIERGLAHFTSLPHVAIDGDTAVVTSYLQILVPQTQGDPVDVPNHGRSKGFRVHRMTANPGSLCARRRAGRSNAAPCVSSTARKPHKRFCGRRSRLRMGTS